MALFLRRFGYQKATSTMSRVLAGRTGRPWRVVTLDDRNTAVSSGRRWTWLLLVVVTGLALAAALDWVASARLSNYTAPLAFIVSPDAINIDLGENQRIASGASAAIIVLAALAVVVGGVGLLGFGSAYRARRQASVTIHSEYELAQVTHQISRRGRRIFAPRLSVVSTKDWQPTVTTLAGICDVLIIDVSNPSQNIVWELENTRSDRWVLVCDDRGHSTLITDRPRPAHVGRLLELIDGHTVLIYGRRHRRFVRSLRRRLTTVARNDRPRPSQVAVTGA